MRSDVKPTPVKYCAYCGAKMERKRYNGRLEDLGAFKRRKYCSWKCTRKGFSFVGYAPDNDNSKAAHARSRKIPFLIQNKERKCEICGAENVRIEVHHIDKDWKNNNPDNLIVLCSKCHRQIHNPKQPKPKCKICGKECVKTTHGMCDKHYLQWKRNGDPLHKPWSTYKEKKSKGPIEVYDKDGNLIKTYKDVRTASKESGYARQSVASACNGNSKTLGGYIWKYVE